MPRVCPRPCSRLATAAVFISVGVIQFTVGLILLRSKYIFLLSGPDFWTSASNLAVGSLLGISASVWKSKRRSAKYVVRRNILAALYLSAIIVNATTATILILSEGNTLLSIQLEKGKYSSTPGEILAYAYAVSVCSPIVCLVVAIVALSGSCFQKPKKRSFRTPRMSGKIPNDELPYLHNWVYTSELPKSGKIMLDSTTSSESSSSSMDSVLAKDIPEEAVQQIRLIEDTRRALHMMSKDRDRILNDGTTPRHLLPTHDQLIEMVNLEGSYQQLKKKHRDEFKVDRESSSKTSGCDCSKKSYKTKSSMTEKPRPPLRSDTLKRKSECENNNVVTYCNDNEDDQKETIVIEDQNSYHSTSNNKNHLYDPCASSSEKTLPKQTSPVVNKSIKINDPLKGKCMSREVTVLVHKNQNPPSKSEASLINDKLHQNITQVNNFKNTTLVPCVVEIKSQSTFPESYKNSVKVHEIKECSENGQLPRNSDLKSESSFEASNSTETPTLEGEVVAIRVNNLSPNPKLTAIQTPVVSGVQEAVIKKWRKAVKEAHEQRGSLDSNFTKGILKEGRFKKGRSASCSSFKNSFRKNKEYSLPKYPKMGSYKTKMGLTPIPESPAEITNTGGTCSSDTSDCISMPGEISSIAGPDSESAENISVQDSICSSILDLSSTQNENLTSGCESTPKKAGAVSPRNVLRKFWFSTGPEAKPDILNQIVDDDSLIGLSEEDLITRQFRYRSLRKAIQQRLKEEQLKM